jgi:hypothetical protein
MHNNLPAPTDPNSYALQQQELTEVLPPMPMQYAPSTAAPFMPNLDNYSSVCVQIREASFIASHDPIACNHPSAIGSCNHGTNAATSRAPMPVQQQKSKKRSNGLPIGGIAAWVCVAQLGVIIWMLAGSSLRLDSIIGAVKGTITTAGSKIDGVFSDINADSITFVSGDDAVKSTGSKKKNKHKVAHSKKSGGFAGFSWPTAKGFVPPPPPGMPTSKMMVPPPPVAMSLFDKGPGAAEAMPLPIEAAAIVPAIKPKKHHTESKDQLELKQTSPDLHLAGKEESDATSIATAPVSIAPRLEAPVPGVARTEASEAAPSAPAVAAAPIAQPPVVMPPQMMQASPPVQHLQTVPSVRTVMAGNRKRTITDR